MLTQPMLGLVLAAAIVSGPAADLQKEATNPDAATIAEARQVSLAQFAPDLV